MGIAALLREQANSKPVLRSHHRPQQARGESHTNSHNAAPASTHTRAATATTFEVGLFRGRYPK